MEETKLLQSNVKILMNQADSMTSISYHRHCHRADNNITSNTLSSFQSSQLTSIIEKPYEDEVDGSQYHESLKRSSKSKNKSKDSYRTSSNTGHAIDPLAKVSHAVMEKKQVRKVAKAIKNK